MRILRRRNSSVLLRVFLFPAALCANVAFGGPKRNHLFMCASQSVYLLRVNIQGASPG